MIVKYDRVEFPDTNALSTTQFGYFSTNSNSNYIKVSKINQLTITLEATQNLDSIYGIQASSHALRVCSKAFFSFSFSFFPEFSVIIF